ncbi:protein kinase domain protein [Ichthyophthirius multifiliis]|uniref:Protein kinase domain protein n=1 Tax=Ichthyophthirius multifiliis TaxID=5932 RepID=G0R5P5_ICHMU|nr:protein kinase domain protein [Ichthyophthirius multifiliis]EGR27218.1 protein kinase domain protein [Ichthyophthirius multifiliis]|eukprot:XP_004024102.1 protein kinase domain protein [Ichthyophthirius multifiliis]
MEYCEGGDLDTYMQKKGGKLEEINCIEIISQVINGFREIVQKGYIHRDIKPQNLLMKSNNIIKIGDFGLAARIDNQNNEFLNDFVGTQLYMSPQILQHQSYNQKADIWSIGIIFYEILFGKTPWPSRDLQSFLSNIQSIPLRFPYDKPVKKETKDFISRCLILNEDKRIKVCSIKSQVVLDEKAKYILYQIQQVITQSNKQINSYLDDNNNNNTINKDFINEDQFYQLLLSIDNRIAKDDSNYLFQNIIHQLQSEQTITSSNNQNEKQISIQLFKMILNEQNYIEIEQKTIQIFNSLKGIFKHKNFDLNFIYSNYNDESKEILNQQKFQQILKILNIDLQKYEINCVFEIFDKKKNGIVTYQQFYQILNELEQKDINKDNLQNKIKLVQNLIKENNLNVQNMFNNLKSSNQNYYLNINDLKKLFSIVDKDLNEKQMEQIFNIFDINKDEKITFEEFKKILS